MRICRLRFENHRAVPDLDIEVRNHLVLVGANESGKTSLLRALDAVLAGSAQAMYASFTPETLRDPALPLTIEVTLTGFSDPDRALFADDINVLVDPLTGQTSELLTLLMTARIEGADVAITRGWSKPAGLRRTNREQLEAIQWGFLPANRSPERELGGGRSSALRQLVGSLDLGVDHDRLAALLTDLNTDLDGTPAVVALRERLAGHLDDLFPRPVEPNDLVVRLTSAEEEDPRAQADVHLRRTEGASVPLHRQSDGLRAMTTIVVQRLARTTQVLGVDEPEIHLHPRSQARIGGLLAVGDGQRVVATHSAAVLAAFPPTDVVVLIDAGCRQLALEKFQANPRLFAQWWTDNALEPLTARSVLLVEGPSDRLLVKSAAIALGYDLDRLGCAVVVAQGANGFRPLIKLFGAEGFQLNVFGLVDLEEAPIAAAALNVDEDAASLRAANFEVSDADLEDECVRALGVPRHLALLVGSGHYEEHQTLMRFGAATPADTDAAAYTAWCRRAKLEVALALASQLQPADAEKLESLVRVIDLIRA